MYKLRPVLTVGGIAEVINSPGLVNLNFEDVRTAMAGAGIIPGTMHQPINAAYK